MAPNGGRGPIPARPPGDARGRGWRWAGIGWALGTSALLGAQAWLAWRSARAYRGLPTLAPAAPPAAAPPVSIIVPARNEATRLPALLPSLAALDYPAYEVVVVDDASTDGTAAVARAAGVRVVPAPPLPSGWAGKPHACQVGAAAARHDWLLFTDADTTHRRGALAAVLALALRDDLEALSLATGQRCVSFWERLLLPYVYRHFFAGVDPVAVNRVGDGQALANGQYLLIHRAAYDRIGGHGAVRASIVEDVALAGVLKRAHVRYRLVRGEPFVQVRMYDGLGALREGFAKNSSRFLAEDRRRGALVVVSTLLDGAALGLLVAAARTRQRAPLAVAVASAAVAAVGLLPWLGWYGTPRRYALLQPLAAAVFQLIALDGVRALRPGGTRWKGRRY